MEHNYKTSSGFTLIELSLVLVIIGLIVGGVLVGRDLIASATIRAQITQIEKYQAASNTFRGKYGYLPGDIPNNEALKFGFMARTNAPFLGNGLLDNSSGASLWGEPLLFWRDLSDARLVDGNFGRDLQNSSFFMPVSTNFRTYLPDAKISSDSSVYVYTGTGGNFFSGSAVISLSQDSLHSRPNMTIQQAYNIDKKIDDGAPMTGRSITMYFNSFTYAYVDESSGDNTQGSYGGIVTANDCQTGDCAQGTPNTADQKCYVDSQTYNMSYPRNVNCTLSFRFQ